MNLVNLNTPMGWTCTTIGALIVGASVWGAARWTRSDEPKVTVPAELTVEALKAGAANPAETMSTVRAAMEREDLTEEQRRQAFQNMRQVWEQALDQRVDEYNTASEGDKTAILDRHIDEMEDWRQAMEERRKEWEKRREQEGDRGPRFGPQSREERKAQSESRDPDKAAQRMAYFQAVGKRMGERGIKPAFGPGGGFGGRRGP